MPVLDRAQGKLVVRIVYDGPAYAGKTTNLKKLCGFFTPRRRSELVAPEESSGRTLVFDWLRVEGGFVGGFPLRCELLTVPGQAVLARRRWKLVELADAIVFVCDSTPRGLQEARTMLGLLRQFLDTQGRADTPIVIQANKQDTAGARFPESVRHFLGLEPEAPVVGAQAEVAIGVRETAVLAIRAAASEAQRALLERGSMAVEGEIPRPEDLHAALVEPEKTEAMSPTQVVLEQLAAREPASTGPSKSPPPAVFNGEREEGPPLPASSVATGLIWPAATGRDVLRRVPVQEARRRHDLVARTGIAQGSGREDVVIYEAGMWCLKTSLRRCYGDADTAKSALLMLARRKVQLGDFVPANTVLSIEADREGRHWLWTTAPWLETIRSVMEHAVKMRDEGALAGALEDFASATIKAMKLVETENLVLDIHPNNLAVVGQRTYYVDDDVTTGEAVPTIGYAILQRFEEYEAWPGAIARYRDALVEGLRKTWSQDQLRRLGIPEAIEQTVVRASRAEKAKRFFGELLARPW